MVQALDPHQKRLQEASTWKSRMSGAGEAVALAMACSARPAQGALSPSWMSANENTQLDWPATCVQHDMSRWTKRIRQIRMTSSAAPQKPPSWLSTSESTQSDWPSSLCTAQGAAGDVGML